MKNLKQFGNFDLNEADLSKKAYIVKKTSTQSGREDRVKYIKGTLEDLIGYFSYTLEIGNSHKRSINRNPKTIKAFIKALQDSFSEKEAAIYNRTGIDLINEIPAGTPASDISDQTLRESNMNEAVSVKITDLAKKIATETEDAYSWEKYPAGDWIKITQFLLDKGYTEDDVNDILRSKYMRWIPDSKKPSFASFIKNFTLDIDKQIEDMIRKEMKREPKTAELNKNQENKVKQFSDELDELIFRYKKVISYTDIKKMLRNKIENIIKF